MLRQHAMSGKIKHDVVSDIGKQFTTCLLEYAAGYRLILSNIIQQRAAFEVRFLIRMPGKHLGHNFRIGDTTRQ
jgi:hypothetical protein